MPRRIQQIWKLKSDNATLEITPDKLQVENIYHFYCNYPKYQKKFPEISYQISKNSSLSKLQLVTSAPQLRMILDKIRHQEYVFIDSISDFTSTYKGIISIFLIAFNDRGYLIDALELNKQLKEFKSIIENPNIIKYCYKLGVMLQDVKRDWGAFGVNFYDFQYIERSLGFKSKLNYSIIRSAERPIIEGLMVQMQDRYENMIKYIAQIRYNLKQEVNEEYTIYAYSNHGDILLKQYHHNISNFQQQYKQYLQIENQKKRKIREEKENNYMVNKSQQYYEDKQDLTIKTEMQKYICQRIIQWRQHMARILDYPPNNILNFPQILAIALERPTSVLKIQQILGGDSIFTVEVASNIQKILKMAAQEQENRINELQLQNTRKTKQDKVKNLLAQLKWQGRQEWLNRKNDESIRLYKQIVSINEFDTSIIDQFNQVMTKKQMESVQLGRFVKYAEYFRKCNYQGLEQFYYQTIKRRQSEDKQKEWTQQQEQLFITGKSIINSQTSTLSSNERFTEKTEEPIHQSSRCSSTITSLQELQNLSNKIEPLPSNIQQIYRRAASAKKTYQKQKTKKKEKEEIKPPSWQDINILFQR